MLPTSLSTRPFQTSGNWRAGCVERRTSGSEGGGWKSTRKGNSLTAYPTTRCGSVEDDPADIGPEATSEGASGVSDRRAKVFGRSKARRG